MKNKKLKEILWLKRFLAKEQGKDIYFHVLMTAKHPYNIHGMVLECKKEILRLKITNNELVSINK